MGLSHLIRTLRPGGDKAHAVSFSFVREERRFLCFTAADAVPEKLVHGPLLHQTTLCPSRH